MSEMVERVARAMVAAQFNEWDELDSGDHGYWRSMAVAAIEAMREPTGAMILAGCDGFWPGDEIVHPDEHDTPEQAIQAGYRAMITQALQEPPTRSSSLQSPSSSDPSQERRQHD